MDRAFQRGDVLCYLFYVYITWYSSDSYVQLFHTHGTGVTRMYTYCIHMVQERLISIVILYRWYRSDTHVYLFFTNGTGDVHMYSYCIHMA